MQSHVTGILKHQPELVQIALKNQPNLVFETNPSDGLSLLQLAAREGLIFLVMDLIANGAPVAEDAFYFAVKRGHILSIVNKSKINFLAFTAKMNNYELVKMLLAQGADCMGMIVFQIKRRIFIPVILLT